MRIKTEDYSSWLEENDTYEAVDGTSDIKSYWGRDGYLIIGKYGLQGALAWDGLEEDGCRDWRLSPYIGRVVDDFWQMEVEWLAERLHELDPKDYWTVVSRKGKEVYVVENWEQYEIDDPDYPGEGRIQYKTSDCKDKRVVLDKIWELLDDTYLDVAYRCYVYYEFHLDSYYDDYNYCNHNVNLGRLELLFGELTDHADMYEFVQELFENTIWPKSEGLTVVEREHQFSDMFRKAYMKTLRTFIAEKRKKYVEAVNGPPIDLQKILQQHLTAIEDATAELRSCRSRATSDRSLDTLNACVVKLNNFVKLNKGKYETNKL